LVWDGQQERVSLGDRFVLPQLLDQDIGLSCVGTTEDRRCGPADEADLVLILTSSSEIGTVTVVNQREDAAADGNPGSASVAGFLPGCPKRTDLGGLLSWPTSSMSGSVPSCSNLLRSTSSNRSAAWTYCEYLFLWQC
jgi:hypothetical protein